MKYNNQNLRILNTYKLFTFIFIYNQYIYIF